jgi:hypothetical protein
MSNLLWPQQMALNGTHFNHAGLYYMVRQTHLIETVALLNARLDISKFLSSGLPEEDSVQVKQGTTYDLKANI